jgi:hypothetical protein
VVICGIFSLQNKAKFWINSTERYRDDSRDRYRDDSRDEVVEALRNDIVQLKTMVETQCQQKNK